MHRALASLVLAALLIPAALSQTTSTQPKPAPNAWMLTPTPYLDWEKDISLAMRAARDKYLDQGAAGQKYPLTSPHADPLGPGIGCGTPRSDIPVAKGRVALIGTFTQHRAVLSKSEFSLYTEVTVHVDEVFEDRTGSGAFPGKDIILIFTGGTVTLKSGRVLSYNTEPIEYSLQPGHRYLLFLTYEREGDFYIVSNDWDVTDGTVRPNTRPGQYRASHGLSSLSGLTVQQLVPALSKLLSENN